MGVPDPETIEEMEVRDDDACRPFETRDFGEVANLRLRDGVDADARVAISTTSDSELEEIEITSGAEGVFAGAVSITITSPSFGTIRWAIDVVLEFLLAL